HICGAPSASAIRSRRREVLQRSSYSSAIRSILSRSIDSVFRIKGLRPCRIRPFPLGNRHCHTERKTLEMNDKQKKPQKLKARLPRGFVDRSAADIRAVNEMTAKIREVYEHYGFDPVETP